jgi:hypothetical protein
MSNCARLSERMPAIALGRSIWTAEESDHLRDCLDCQDEWSVVQRSASLGSDLAADFDSTATARMVLQRLATQRENFVLKKRSWAFAALSTAAAMIAVLWSGNPAIRPQTSPVPAVAALQLPLPELDSLQPGELNAVLQTLEQPNMGDSTDSSAADDLDDGVLDGGYDPLEG